MNEAHCVYERSQLGWFWFQVRMPPGRFSREVFWACSTVPGHTLDYVCLLAWEHLSIPSEVLEEMGGEREVWAALLRLQPKLG